MTLLLDTHALLWWLDDPALLSEEARRAIADEDQPVLDELDRSIDGRPRPALPQAVQDRLRGAGGHWDRKTVDVGPGIAQKRSWALSGLVGNGRIVGRGVAG